jgi:cytochrome c peroxidase
VTKTVSDEYVFRVPPLRNVELTPPYFHSGQVWDLNQAVGIMAVDQLGKSLNDDQVAKITAFLKSFPTDRKGRHAYRHECKLAWKAQKAPKA